MRNSKKGFTIIEMVIVIAIIGILASVLIPTYGNVVASANESAALQGARSSMTNWLATNTGANGVPQSGDDYYGNKSIVAYFESTQGGTVYTYAYENGTVVKTDVDWSVAREIKDVYLNNTDPGAEKVSFYRFEREAKKNASEVPNGKYFEYYIKWPASQYGCIVYAKVPENQTYYTYAAGTEGGDGTWTGPLQLGTATWPTGE